MESILNDLLARTLNQLSTNPVSDSGARLDRREDVTPEEPVDLRSFLRPSDTFEHNLELLQWIHSIEMNRQIYDARRRHMRVLSDAMEDYQHNVQSFLRALSSVSQHRSFRPRPPRTAPAQVPLRPQVPIRASTRGLSDAQVELSTRTLVYDASVNSEPRCPISLEDFTAGEEIAQIIGCGHYFKCAALREWFHRNTQCPVCRYNVSSMPEQTRTTTTAADAWTTILAGLISSPDTTRLYTVESLTVEDVDEVD